MLKTMRFFPFLRTSGGWLSLVCLFAFGLAAVRAQSPAVILAPAMVEAGSPELIRVAASGGASLDGEWLGRKLDFFRGRDGRAWFALAGVDVEAPAGPSTLTITLRLAQGGVRHLSRTIEIHPAAGGDGQHFVEVIAHQ